MRYQKRLQAFVPGAHVILSMPMSGQMCEISGRIAAGGEANGATPAPLQHLSPTELYTRYAEASEKWRVERLKNRQNEIVLEQVAILIDIFIETQ